MKKILLASLLLIVHPAKSQITILADANFETTYGPMTFSSNGTNVWQIGVPNKPFFGTAQSPPNAIMTDTINPYPANNESSFILNNTDLISGYVHNLTDLTFDHKYQTSAGLDGGAIEVSYDHIHWQNCIADTFYQSHSQLGGSLINTNLYDTTNTLFNGAYGFSGTSNGWIHTDIMWMWYPPVLRTTGGGFSMPDSMFIRFTFYSDSTADSLDGWMIDNILLTGQDPSGIPEVLFQHPSINISPQPSSGIIKISIQPEIHPVKYSVHDLAGRLIKDGTAQPAFSLNVEDLENGIYQLGILTDQDALLVKSMMVVH